MPRSCGKRWNLADAKAHLSELVERAAEDERHWVKKGVNMALRATGKRNRALNAAAVAVAERLSASPNAAARWVGKDALRELVSPALMKRLNSTGLTR